MTGNGGIFFSCDWGTSSFRLRGVDCNDGRIVAEVVSDCGVKSLREGLGDSASVDERSRVFEDYLGRQIAALQRGLGCGTGLVCSVISGMASSSVGWEELPYAAVPFPVDGSAARIKWLTRRVGEGESVRVLLVSGLATEVDVMRGEETQLIGLLARPEYEEFVDRSVVVLPGTHSKHIRVRSGRVVDFQTYLTGELFAVLSQHSILRFTTVGGEEELDPGGFMDGVESARRHGFSRSLFRVRTGALLQGRGNPANRSFLSGLLVGVEWLELRGETDDEDTPILLAGAGDLVSRYETAASILGLEDRLTVASGEELKNAVVAGHRRLLQQFGSDSTGGACNL